MPSETDRSALRARLVVDRGWAVYALGDLSPDHFLRTTWHVAPEGDALLMLYGAFETPVLYAQGRPEDVAPLLDEITHRKSLYLSIRPEILPLIEARYTVSHITPMWRMVLEPARFPDTPAPAVRLSVADYPALLRLHADGEATGEVPDFFSPEMAAQGIFYGVREGDELVATAGTHLVVPTEGVAAVGSVYTRRDRRGRGLSRQVTGAVTAALVRAMPPGSVIGLNVRQDNAPALSVYQRLGYTFYCKVFEGLAKRP
jgi:ribosomal protein S18 acetylase RimI-like enzyme